MFRFSLFILMLIITPVNAGANSSTSTILVIGDSISAAYGIETQYGWVNLLASKIAQEKMPYQVINASISGDTTVNGLNRLQPVLEKYKPAIVILELGGNDGLRGFPIKRIKSNLEEMIKLCQRFNAKVLLAGMKIPPNYGKRYTQAFHNIYRDMEKQFSLQLIPFLLDNIGDNGTLMQSDGLHPTKNAQPVIMQTVWLKLKDML